MAKCMGLGTLTGMAFLMPVGVTGPLIGCTVRKRMPLASKLSVGERKSAVEFIQSRQINSYQKLRVLFFFYDHADSSWSSRQIGTRLYLGEGPFPDEIIADLQAAGLLNCSAECCRLRDEAEITADLEHLIKTCENPLARQEILDGLKRRSAVSGR